MQVLATDHQPLLKLLNDRSVADMQNRRLQNLKKEKTLSYQFNVVHVPGKKNLGPDAASRYPPGDPVRLVLPGEPPETDLPSFPSTTEMRAILLAGIAQVEMDVEPWRSAPRCVAVYPLYHQRTWSQEPPPSGM